MKKALIVTTISGFLPQFGLNDVKILQSMGYEVYYASNFNRPVYRCDEEELKEMGIKLFPVPIEKSPTKIFKNFGAIMKLKRLIEKEKIQLVHVHNPVGAVVGRIAASMAKNKPIVMYTAHGFHFYKGAPLKNWIVFYTIERFFARFTDILVTINKEDYDRAKKFKYKKGGFAEQIHGVGVNFKKFAPNKEIEVAKREEIEVPHNAFHIFTAAELNENKKQSVVIEAISLMDRDDVYYSLCGKGPNAENLQALIEEKNLQDRVRLLGYRYDMHEILQTADCFAFPSIREGLGIAAIEALACSVPLVASDNRGTREYIKEDYNGLLCDAHSVSDFKKAIETLMTNKEKRERLAGNARETAKAFSLEENDRMMRLIFRRADMKVRG